MASKAGILVVVGGSAKLEGAAPLAFVAISFFSGLEKEGWLREGCDLRPWMWLEVMGVVGGCDDMERAVGGAVFDEGSLKEKFGTGPAE